MIKKLFRAFLRLFGIEKQKEQKSLPEKQLFFAPTPEETKAEILPEKVAEAPPPGVIEKPPETTPQTESKAVEEKVPEGEKTRAPVQSTT